MSNPLVTVIIVSYNGRRFLDDCLNSLSKITYKNTEIIFVDNASSDGSAEYVRKKFPKIKIIVNKKNLGFAEGHDEAFKKAKGDSVLLLSMDTIVNKNFLNELIKILYSKKDIGAVQPKLLMYPEKNTIDSLGSLFLFTGALYHIGREKDHRKAIYNKQMEIFSGKGACILFKREVLKKTGLFDKDYFAYFEESDLCHRIWLAGYKIIYTPRAIVYHKGGGSSKQIVSGYIQFHSHKNRICTYLKNLSFKNIIRVVPLTIFLYESACVLYLLKGDYSTVWAIQKSIFWNFFNIRKTLKKRKFIQKNIRVVKDEDFLPRVTKPVRLSYYYHLFDSMKKYSD